MLKSAEHKLMTNFDPLSKAHVCVINPGFLPKLLG